MSVWKRITLRKYEMDLGIRSISYNSWTFIDVLFYNAFAILIDTTNQIAITALMPFLTLSLAAKVVVFPSSVTTSLSISRCPSSKRMVTL
jgi:hypothetical protein